MSEPFFSTHVTVFHADAEWLNLFQGTYLQNRNPFPHPDLNLLLVIVELHSKLRKCPLLVLFATPHF